jgi:hypothetical protein
MNFVRLLQRLLYFKKRTVNTDLSDESLVRHQIKDLQQEIEQYKIKKINEINQNFNAFRSENSKLKSSFLVKLQEKEILSFFSAGFISHLWNNLIQEPVYLSDQKNWKVINFKDSPNALFAGGDPGQTLNAMINFVSSHFVVNHAKTLYFISKESDSKFEHFKKFKNVVFSHDNLDNNKTKVKKLLKTNYREIKSTLEYLSQEMKARIQNEFPAYEIIFIIENIDYFLLDLETRDLLTSILRNGPSFKIYVIGSIVQGKSNLLSFMDYDFFKNIFLFKTSEKESKLILQSPIASTLPDNYYSIAQSKTGEIVGCLNKNELSWAKIFMVFIGIDQDSIQDFSHLNKIV